MVNKYFFSIFGLATATIFAAGCAPKTLPQSDTGKTGNHPVARVTYDCADTPNKIVRYPDNFTAVVPYHDKKHELQSVVSASGARYADDDIIWWTQGSGPGTKATLYHATKDHGTGNKITACHQSSSSRTQGS